MRPALRYPTLSTFCNCYWCQMKRKPDLIHAPFTPDQVAALQRWQDAGTVHPFTCGTEHEGDKVLIPRADGWHCPICGYRQLWAHRVMLDEPPVIPF